MSSEFAKTYSTSELSRKSGDIIADALRAPVAITQRGKARLVVLSVADFEKLLKAQDRRKAYRLEDVPDDTFAEMKTAFSEYLNDEGE